MIDVVVDLQVFDRIEHPWNKVHLATVDSIYLESKLLPLFCVFMRIQVSKVSGHLRRYMLAEVTLIEGSCIQIRGFYF